MAKKYKGSLTLEWKNKNKSILFLDETENPRSTDVDLDTKLHWVNEDESLYFELDEKEAKGKKAYWVDRKDIRVKEVRPLIHQKTYRAEEHKKKDSLLEKEFTIKESNEDFKDILSFDDNDGILIKGDNLLALNILVKLFESKPEGEKVKCICIDPPYNTKNAFEYYDDNIEHSEWLTLMRDRLVLLQKLLKEDGVIFTQANIDEIGYLRVLMDSVFGRNNFISQICWQRTSQRGVLGQGQTPIIDIIEFILVYSKDKQLSNMKKIRKSVLANDKLYNQYDKKIFIGERKLYKELENGEDTIRIYKHFNFKIETIPKENKNEEYYKNHFLTIARYDTQQKESSLEQFILSNIEKNDTLFSVDRIPRQGKSKNKLITTYYINDNVAYFLNKYAKIVDNKIFRLIDMNNYWSDDEIPTAGIANEGNVEFKRSKKPELLINRILEISTEVDDIVLDCFGGSGTTFAVAHKMGRKWIGVEIGNHADTHIIPRMKNVMSGEDQSGISKSVEWKGGGSFSYYHLGHSIISLDKKGNPDFNWKLGRTELERSLLMTYDYEPEASQKKDHFTIGHKLAGGKKISAIATLSEDPTILNAKGEVENPGEFLSFMEFQTIWKRVEKSDFVYLYTNRGVEISESEIPENLEIVKVPSSIFQELEE